MRPRLNRTKLDNLFVSSLLLALDVPFPHGRCRDIGRLLLANRQPKNRGNQPVRWANRSARPNIGRRWRGLILQSNNTYKQTAMAVGERSRILKILLAIPTNVSVAGSRSTMISPPTSGDFPRSHRNQNMRGLEFAKSTSRTRWSFIPPRGSSSTINRRDIAAQPSGHRSTRELVVATKPLRITIHDHIGLAQIGSSACVCSARCKKGRPKPPLHILHRTGIRLTERPPVPPVRSSCPCLCPPSKSRPQSHSAP